MHEFSTMYSIVQTVLKAAEARGAEKVLEVNLEVGRLTFLNPEQLKFAFKVISEGTIAEGAKLNIRSIEPKVKCLKCGYVGSGVYEGPEYHVLGLPLPVKCGRCGSMDVEFLEGRECKIKNISIWVERNAKLKNRERELRGMPETEDS
ncbi:hydrogenase maturation nickel metallochaperone HypA [Candidatus Bathyarchaeota archaeon]|nr:hydrogenase maturation nickel metallochaperone HypA [Candidatus Bathyarchaeota archaeon]